MSDKDLDYYEQLLLLRMAEEKVIEHYFDDEMKTPCHLSVGQEHIAVGVCDALGPEDKIFGTYRSHGFYLARTRETRNFFLEMHGRGTAWAKGKAGSMHLAAPNHNYMATSAVVGTTIPVAMGAAFAKKVQKEPGFVAVFFGDGAVDEGVFWESVNYASLARLPLLFVCEDNGLAIHASIDIRHGYDSITEIVKGFRCHVVHSDSTDPAEISRLTTEAMEQHQRTGRPALLHIQCYRYLQHVGMKEDFAAGYRTRESFEEWYARDSIKLVRERLLGAGVKEADLEAIRERIATELSESVAAALAAPFPADEELYTDVFA